MDKDGLDVQIKGRQVRVKSNKKIEFANGVSVHRRERRSGNLVRVLVIPADIDGDKAKAEYRDGVLALHLSSKYAGLEPIYTEYEVGHFQRSFSLSSKIDQGGISARVDSGVLHLHLPKTREAAPRRVSVQ